MPYLSVIVPIYNVEKYLNKCVDSILAQSFTDFELILVDDGSPDNCPSICDEYSKKDERIKVIHKKNGGLSDARNAGLDIAQGEYISFIDSDDYISAEMYQNMLDLAIKTNADIVSCGLNYVDETGKIIGEWPQLNENKIYDRSSFINNYYPDVKRDIMPSACNKIFNKHIFKEIRFPVGKIYEDAFIQLKILDLCNLVVVDKKHYYYYLERESSIIKSTFSIKRFDSIEFTYHNYLFFYSRKLIEQSNFAMISFLDNYFSCFFYSKYNNKELINTLSTYSVFFKEIYRKALFNDKICLTKKLAIFFFPFANKISYSICKKYFPECIQYN